MKIHIDLELTPRVKRLTVLLAGASVLVFGGAVAYAQPTPASSDTLIGSALHTLGNAVATLQSEVTALQAADRTFRATVATPGTVVAQTGRWVTRVDNPYAGTHTLTFAAGTFSAPPTCVATAAAISLADQATVGGPVLFGAYMVCGPASVSSITCQQLTAKGVIDTGFSILCSGPP
jgi:hypothetical protein